MRSTSHTSRRALLLASLLGLALLIPSQAMADAGSVRYSYEQVQVGATVEWALVPHAALSTLKGRATKSKVIGAFDLLKRWKKSTYGKASIQIKGNLPRAQVTVNIDPAFSKYALIVMAETVYTLSEMGIASVSFPGYASGPLTRSDIPISVYTLTVPMWKALTVPNLSPAQVMLADGSTVDSAAFYARWKKKDAKLVKQLYAYLKSPQSYTVITVLNLLPGQKVNYVDQVLPLLSHPIAGVRTEALKVLGPKNKDKKVLQAVASYMGREKDAKLARAAASFLGSSRDKSFQLLEPLFLLERGSQDEAIAATAKLAKFKSDKRVVPALVQQLGNKSTKISTAAANALAKVEADAAQIASLGKSGLPAALRIDIARDLAKDKDEVSKIAGLNHLARNGEEREAISSIVTIAKMKSDGARKTVEVFLTDKTPWRKQAAAHALRDVSSVAALPAFSKAIKKGDADRVLENAGYSIMLSLKLKEILAQTKAKDSVIQRLAYLAVGERAKKEKAGSKVFDTLKSGASNRDPLIRGAVARALSAFPDKKSVGVLETLSGDKRPEVRRDVAVSLANFPEGTLTNTLVKYLDDKNSDVQGAAMDALGLRKEALAWDKMKARVSSKEGVVRGAALRALARLVDRNDKTALSEVMSMLSGAVSDKNVSVRKSALTSLGTIKNQAPVITNTHRIKTTEIDLPLAAVLALGTTKHSSAKELIAGALDDSSLKVRRAAIESAATYADKSLKKSLQARLSQEKDSELQGLLKTTIKKL